MNNTPYRQMTDEHMHTTRAEENLLKQICEYELAPNSHEGIVNRAKSLVYLGLYDVFKSVAAYVRRP